MARPEPSMQARWTHPLLLSLTLLVAVVIGFEPVRQNGFINFDDPQYVTENPQVMKGLTWDGATWALTARYAGNWHPLTWLSHMLDIQLFGLEAPAHHLVSLFIHAINTLLLFGLLRDSTGATGKSAVVAGLFAVHPLHVESVAWVAERKDVLSALFSILTLWAYAAWARRPAPTRYAAMVGLFALGLSAKPMAVTLPFVMLLLDYWPLDRFARTPFRRLVLEKVPLFALALASSVVTLIAQQAGGALKGLDALPVDQRVANALVSYIAYLGQAAWPADLAAIYPYRSIHIVEAVAALALLGAITLAAIRTRRMHPYLLVGWLWYLGMLVPVIGLVQVGSQPMADRYTYLPLIGVFIMLSWGTEALLAGSKYRGFLPLTAAGALVACLVVTRGQVGYWKDSVSLWQRALEVTSENHRAQHNLAHALTKEGRLTEAVPHYEEALRIRPGDAEAHNNLGHVLSDLGRVDEATSHFADAVRLVPAFVEAHNNLGMALAGQGKVAEAIVHFEEALRINPELAPAHNNLGVALMTVGRLDDAARHFQEALRIKPDYKEASRNLALTHAARGTDLAGQGKVDEAIQQLVEAIRIKPDEADFQYDLAVLLYRKGRTDEALAHFRAALSVNPTHAAAQDALRAIEALGLRARDAGNPSPRR